MTYEPTWDLGRKRRLGRIMLPDSGRAVVAAVDHPLSGSYVDWSWFRRRLLVTDGQPDVMQMTPGTTTLAAGGGLLAPGTPRSCSAGEMKKGDADLLSRMRAGRAFRIRQRGDGSRSLRGALPPSLDRCGTCTCMSATEGRL